MVYMLLANGFEEVEAMAPLDILRRAGVEVRTVSIEPTERVEGAHGITVLADMLPAEANESIDLLILPGGMPGSSRLDASSVTDHMIERACRDGGRLAAICAAPMVLGKRGLLRGKRATCYPGFEGYLEGATVDPCPVVTDGDVTTAIGMGAAIAFGAELVALLRGSEVSENILSAIKAKK